MDNERKYSSIWNFFVPIDKEYAKCKLCKTKYSYRTSISNLKRHCERKHETYFRKHADKDSKKLDKNVLTRQAASISKAVEENQISENQEEYTLEESHEDDNIDTDAGVDNFDIDNSDVNNADIDNNSDVKNVDDILCHARTQFSSTSNKPMKQMFSEKTQQENGSHYINLYNNLGEDECDTAGKRFAWHLRDMSKKQRLIAEKICFDVLFYGRMDQLEEDSTITLSLRSSSKSQNNSKKIEKIIFDGQIH